MKKINEYVDIVSGVFLSMVGVLAYVLSLSIVERTSSENSVGPKFMPQLIAILIIITGVLVVSKAKKDMKLGIKAYGEFPEEKRDIITVVVTIAIIIMYASSLKTLGFILASMLYLFVQLSLLQVNWKKSIIKNVIISVLVSCICFALFRYVFSLTLPTGTLF